MAGDFNVRVLNLNTPDKIRTEIEKIGADPRGVEIMTPKSSFRTVKLEGVNFAAANIIKQEMLSKGGEAAISRRVFSKKEADRDFAPLSGSPQEAKNAAFQRSGCDSLRG
jgi:dihydropteroate synthase